MERFSTLFADICNSRLCATFLLTDRPASVAWNVLIVKLKNHAKPFCISQNNYFQRQVIEFLLALASQLY